MAAAIRCPKCQGGDVRYSRWRSADGLRRKLFFTSYRCRTCRTRFWRVDTDIFSIVAAVVLILVAAGAGGWALRDRLEPDANAAGAESTNPVPEAFAATPPGVNAGLRDRAERGDASAQASLALAYQNGRGAKKDLAQALAWAEHSARQGDAEGQHALATMYLSGRGTLQNFQKAFEWFDKAARQSHAESQYRLGSMYRSGHGVGVDKTRAYVWLSLAAAQGHQRAAEDRDSLLFSLTPDQIARAQREAQDWRPTPAKP